MSETRRCENCVFWNDGKVFTKFELGEIAKYGIGCSFRPCSIIADHAIDPGYETEGVETKYTFGCIFFEVKP